MPATPATHRQQLGGLLQPHSSPLWSPMLPAAPAGAAQGAGLLGTLRKAPAASHHSADGALTATANQQAAPAASQPNDAPPAWQLEHPDEQATPSRGGNGCAAHHGAAQLRRQLQGFVPELTLTLPPPLAAPLSAAAQHLLQHHRTVPDRETAQGLLDRMARLREAAATLLHEQAAAVKCTAAGAEFRRLMPAPTLGGGSTALAVIEQRHGGSQQQQQLQRQRQQRGPGAAAVQRLVQLRQLQREGAQLTAQLQLA
jgi:hypothetical protein